MFLRDNVCVEVVQQAVPLGAARIRALVFAYNLVVASAETAVFLRRWIGMLSWRMLRMLGMWMLGM